MRHQIDTNDLAFLEKRFGRITEWVPCPLGVSGKINPQVTTVHLGNNTFASLFHIKPVYYEDIAGNWRPLTEVTHHHGNHRIEFNENWWKVHPRFLAWLDKRARIIGGQILIPTPYIGRAVHNSLASAKVGLTTTTVYPDPSPETTTVDGHCSYDTTSTAWATIRVASTSAGVNDSGATVQQYVGNYNDGSNKYWLYRGFYLFDTSAIGDTDTIDSATFSVKPTSVLNDDLSITAGNKGFRLVQTTPASNTALATDDHDQVGSTAGGTDTATTSFLAGSYYDWALNATGLTWVSKTGVTKLGIRHLCDVNDEEPDAPGSADDYNLMYANSADTAGTTSDPKLVVVHTAGSSGPANVKTWNGITTANTKTVNGIAIASVKSGNGIL